MKNINNKGFTLIELLAVIVILIIIVSIAIPTISASIQRTNAKQEQNKKELILSAAQLYISDHKSKRTDFYNYRCYIDVESNLIADGYITEKEITHNGEVVGKSVYYNLSAKKIEVVDSTIDMDTCS